MLGGIGGRRRRERQRMRWLDGITDLMDVSLRCRFNPWVGKIPWRREWFPTSELLPGEFYGQRSLAGCSPWGHEQKDTAGNLKSCRFMEGVFEALERSDDYFFSQLFSFKAVPMRDSINPRSLACLFFNSLFWSFFFFSSRATHHLGEENITKYLLCLSYPITYILVLPCFHLS